MHMRAGLVLRPSGADKHIFTGTGNSLERLLSTISSLHLAWTIFYLLAGGDGMDGMERISGIMTFM